MMTQIYLASSSPRRRELLALLGIPFECLSAEVDEQQKAGELPEQYVVRLAQQKAQAGVNIAQYPLPVLGADTIVVVDGQVLGKPQHPQQAAEMLRLLSGRAHTVITALAFANKSYCCHASVVTEVVFRKLTEKDIQDYIATEEPMDKAGAYGIQGRGGCFVRSIKGSYHAVVGLPLVQTQELLDSFQILSSAEEQ